MTTTETNGKTKKTVVPTEKTEPKYALRTAVNRLLDDFTTGLNFSRLFDEVTPYTPKLDMQDAGKEIVVTTELPGLSREDVKINLYGNRLVISGEKTEEKEEKSIGYYRMERSYGAFKRAIMLPCEVMQDGVDAVLKNGVLKVTLPKVKPVEDTGKAIEIKGQ